MPDETLRAFIAIELPGLIKSALAELQQRLRAGGLRSLRWVSLDSSHLTLHFLGSVERKRIHELVAAMAEASEGIPPFWLSLAEAGAFPNLRRPRVLWVGLDGNLPLLDRLQSRLEANLRGRGFRSEERKFTPHLTLGRLKEGANLAELRQIEGLLGRLGEGLHAAMEVRELSLMQSTLLPSGAVHTKLVAVELKNH